MHASTTRRREILGFAAAALVAPQAILAQDFSGRPIRLLVGFAPGGSADYVARLLAPKLAEQLATTVIVENRVGASGLICSEYVARSAPDGFTLMVSGASATVIAPQTLPKAPFNAVTDLTAVNAIGLTPQVIAVPASLGVRNLKELLALARTRQVSLASAGTGGMTHLTIEMLIDASKANLLHVPYKGAGPAITDTLAGHVQGLVMDASPVMPMIEDGRLVAVAVTSEKRSDILPNTGAVVEDVPGFGAATNWSGLFAPAKTPKAVVDKLNAALLKVLAREDVSGPLRKSGVTPAPMASPDAYQRFVADEYRKWGRIIRDKNIVTTG